MNWQTVLIGAFAWTLLIVTLVGAWFWYWDKKAMEIEREFED